MTPKKHIHDDDDDDYKQSDETPMTRRSDETRREPGKEQAPWLLSKGGEQAKGSNPKTVQEGEEGP